MSLRRLAFAILFACCATGAAPRDQTWLIVSDIHLDPYDRSGIASPSGEDTNQALFDSLVKAVQQQVPNPSEVLLTGDFLAHHFANLVHRHATSSTPEAEGERAMREIAGRLGAVYPRVPFVPVLGNNDDPCADYSSETGGAYLNALTAIWLPLVARPGVQTDFATSFPRGGSYVTSTSVPGLRFVAIDTVFLSKRFGGDCFGGSHDQPARVVPALDATLAATPPGLRNVVVMHIPPGYDDITAEISHGLIVAPFIAGANNAALLDALAVPDHRVAFAIAAHIHHFELRLDDRIPIVVAGAVSPIFDTAPAFYALRIAPDGAIRDIVTYSYDAATQRWSASSFAARWQVAGVNAASIESLHERLGEDEALRRAWGWGGAWRAHWCAQTVLRSGYESCAHLGGRLGVVIRTIVVLLAPLLVLAVMIAVAVILLRQRSGGLRR
jgi:hypothetical protein